MWMQGTVPNLVCGVIGVGLVGMVFRVVYTIFISLLHKYLYRIAASLIYVIFVFIYVGT